MSLRFDDLRFRRQGKLYRQRRFLEFHLMRLHLSDFFPFGREKMRYFNSRFQLYERQQFFLRRKRRFLELYILYLYLSGQLYFERNQVRSQYGYRLFDHQHDPEHPEQE